jgi:hypothetical protein
MKNARTFAISLFIASLLQSACSSPVATEAVVVAPVASANSETVASTHTPTSEPSATPTEELLQLEVVDTFAWTDIFGDFQVYALVRNPYDFPVSVLTSQSVVRLLDSEGEVLLEATSVYVTDGAEMGGLGQILPGETLPAATCFTCQTLSRPYAQVQDKWETVEIVLMATEQTPIAYTSDFDIVVDSFYPTSMAGTVTNTGDQTLSSVFVRVVIFDQDHNFVDWAEAEVQDYIVGSGDLTEIPPGTVLDFFAFLNSPIDDEPLNYEITVIGRFAEE